MDVDVVVFFIFGSMWWLLLREDCKLICVNIKCVFGKDLIRKKCMNSKCNRDICIII